MHQKQRFDVPTSGAAQPAQNSVARINKQIDRRVVMKECLDRFNENFPLTANRLGTSMAA